MTVVVNLPSLASPSKVQQLLFIVCRYTQRFVDDDITNRKLELSVYTNDTNDAFLQNVSIWDSPRSQYSL